MLNINCPSLIDTSTSASRLTCRNRVWDQINPFKLNTVITLSHPCKYPNACAMSRLLILLGIALLLLGLAWPFLSKLPFGQLPGDILIRHKGFTFYFPISTCLIVSAVISLILWLWKR